MRTSKPFSTISYNTDKFLKAMLDELIAKRKIEFYAFIEHLPEDDETKAHKHLLIVPNGAIDTDQVQEYLTELDPEKPDKPLGCIMFRSSKFGDWYLYVLHDTGYLAQKGQSRTFHYKPDEITVSDKDYFNELRHTIDYTPYNRFMQIRQFAEDGLAFAELVAMGIIPPQQVAGWEKTYNLLLSRNTFRNGKDGHDDEEPITPTLAKHDENENGLTPFRRADVNENGAIVTTSPQPIRTATPNRPRRSHSPSKRATAPKADYALTGEAPLLFSPTEQ